MTRPRGADDHAVGPELVCWHRWVLDLDGFPARLPHSLGGALLLAVQVQHAQRERWNEWSVSRTFGCVVADVEVVGPSSRWTSEVVRWSPAAARVVRDRGWCVELWRGGRS